MAENADFHCCVNMRLTALRKMSIISSFLLSMMMLSLPAGTSAGGGLPKLLLITFDGLGWNLLSKIPASELPGFQAFIEKGVHVKWVENVFPTETRPNHMSLVTGLYSESHGIVANYFYDPTLQEAMPAEGKLKEEDSKWVDVGAEPVWITNSKAGNGRRSGTIYWPCADAKIKGRMPDEFRRGEWTVSQEAVSGTERIDLALDWLIGKSTQTVNFVAVYSTEPDQVSHKWGPDSQQVLDAIRSHDAIVKHLLSEIEKRNLEDELNVIITADHGHLPVYPEITINLDLLIDPSWYTPFPRMNGQPLANLWPKEGYYEKVVEGLKGKHRNLHVATRDSREELEKLHYSSSPRIAPVVVYTEPGWLLITNASMPLGYRGQHGWDPRFSANMWPFFMAKGPAFKQGVREAEPFHLVDIYPLMCHILHLHPAPNNGSLSRAAHILSSWSGETCNTQGWSAILAAVAVGGMLVILVDVILFKAMRYTKYRRIPKRPGEWDAERTSRP